MGSTWIHWSFSADSIVLSIEIPWKFHKDLCKIPQNLPLGFLLESLEITHSVLRGPFDIP